MINWLLVRGISYQAVRVQSMTACSDYLAGLIQGQDAITTLPGATVYLQESKQRTAANVNGNFRLVGISPVVNGIT
jgi:hypothetical protein